MSSFFKTWTEIANYVTDALGFEYLTNPSSWMDAFKELVGDARYVGDDTFYQPNPTGNWVNVGKTLAPSVDSGVKAPPAVTNIVTDVATGTAVIGEAAAAVEQTGIFIELSVAGYFATALTGLGLGVASYEAFPEFWTDISNYVFGTSLTPAETEPFLRKKIKSVLSTDSVDGKPVTFIPEELIKRTYDFLKQHINVTDIHNTFPTATIDQTSGSIIAGSSQQLNYLEETYLSKASLQGFVNGVVDVLHTAGYTNVPALNISDLYDQMQSQLDLSGLDLITYQCGYDWNLWNNAFVNNTGDTLFNYIGVNGYRLTPQQKSNICILQKARKFTANDIGFITTISPGFTKDPDISGCVTIWSPPNGGTPTYQVSVAQNGTAGFCESDYAQGYNSLQRYVGYYIEPTNGEGTPHDGGFNGWINHIGSYSHIKYSNPIDEEEADVDSYLNGKAVITGRTPKNGTSFEDRYPNRQDDKKDVSQPNKNGADTKSSYVRGTAPISNNTTEQVIHHGVNNSDPDSYKEDQDSNTGGKNTPNKASADDVNDSIDENINQYNDSQIDPYTAPEPAPATQPLPDYPNNPPQKPSGDTGDTPDPTLMPGMTASGMVSVYNPTKTEVKNFSAWLWTANVIENLKKILANPVDAIIGMHIMYATPITGSPENIVCGYLDSGVAAKVVTQQYIEVDCGHVTVPEYYGNALDYEPYTQVHCYLPFVGIQTLKANDVLGKELYIKYGVDVLTGTVLAILTTKKDGSEISCYQFAGNCAVQIPLTGGNYAEIIKGIASMTVGVAGSIATANPLPAIGGVVGAAMGSSLDVSRSGSLGANAGVMGVRKPYLIITRRKAYDSTNYNKFYGFPANKTIQLSTCKGYTRVKSTHIDSISRATDSEKTEIETLLKQGVVIK